MLGIGLTWVRGVTLDTEESTKEDNEEEDRVEQTAKCSVLLTDYGYVVKINVDQLFLLPEEFSVLRRQVDIFCGYCFNFTLVETTLKTQNQTQRKTTICVFEEEDDFIFMKVFIIYLFIK